MQEGMVTYSEIRCAQKLCFVTGIRQDAGVGAPVVMTGMAGESENTLQAVLYCGPLLANGDYNFVSLTPCFLGQTVTSSAFYGPNTARFDPRIGVGKVRAVGSYKYRESEHPNFDHGMMYLGCLNGSGIWTKIDVPEEVAGAEVANTIPTASWATLSWATTIWWAIRRRPMPLSTTSAPIPTRCSASVN